MSARRCAHIALWISIVIINLNEGECRPTTFREMIQPTIDRVTKYGYHILGYDSAPHGPHGDGYHHGGHDDSDIKFKFDDKLTIWDGHLEFPNVFPGIMDTMGGYLNSGVSDEDRVVKGWDKRVGFKVGVPYVGDFQYIREMGPGRFTDKLGPGKFNYPGPKDRPPGSSYGDVPSSYYILPQNDPQYNGLKNYPWYRRK